jgi:hypothetical protein
MKMEQEKKYEENEKINMEKIKIQKERENGKSI